MLFEHDVYRCSVSPLVFGLAERNGVSPQL